MDGNTRAYTDVLAAGPDGPPVLAQRETTVHPCCCSAVDVDVDVDVDVEVAVAVAVAVAIAIAAALSRLPESISAKQKKAATPTSIAAHLAGGGHASRNAQNHQNMCRPPFTA